MTGLEGLQRGATVKGILLDGLVNIIDAIIATIPTSRQGPEDQH